MMAQADHNRGQRATPTQKMVAHWHRNQQHASEEAYMNLFYHGVDKEGKDTYPDATQRQTDLAYKTVNAALETLKAELTNKFTKAPPHSDVRRKILQRINKIRSFNDANDLVENCDDAMTRYYTQMARFLSERASFHAMHHEIGDRLRDETAGAAPIKLTPPQDPRIKAFVDMFGDDIIGFMDSGCKNEENAREKISRNPAQKFLALKDINRLTVIPATPELADIFSLKLQDQFSGDQMFVDEGWHEHKHSGCIDRKCYVALTERCKEPDGQHDPRGFIAEVRIVGPHMHKADMQTHDNYEFLRPLVKRTAQQLVEEHRKTPLSKLQRSPIIVMDSLLKNAIYYLERNAAETGIDIEKDYPALYTYKRQTGRKKQEEKHLYHEKRDDKGRLMIDADVQELDALKATVEEINKKLYAHEMGRCTPEWKTLYDAIRRQEMEHDGYQIGDHGRA